VALRIAELQEMEALGVAVQRPLATVVIGGVVTATILTLLVLPVFYSLLGGKSRAA
jgi:cobalt-zinc-cadmium resistance protein CzcA